MADGGTKPSLEALVSLVDYVSAARQKIRFDIPHVRSKGIHNGAQAFVMWRNRQKAAHRMKVDLDRLATLSADDRQWLGLSSAQAPASTLLSEDEKESVIFLDVFFRIVFTSPNGVVNSLIRMPIVKKQKEAVCSVLDFTA